MNSGRILDAILRTSIYSYEFDVSTGIIEHDIIGRNGKNYSEMMGLHAPYAFDDVLTADFLSKIHFLSEKYQQHGSIITRDTLLSAFEEGKDRIETIVYIAERNRYYRLTYYLWQDDASGHIHALSVCDDMTEEHQEYLHRQLKEAEQAWADALIESEIISSLGKMFFAMYRVDIAQNHYMVLAGNNGFYSLSGMTGPAQETLNSALPLVIAEEYKDRMLEFTRISTLVDRLKTTDTLSCEYKTLTGTWHEASIIAQKRNDHGDVTHVLYIVRVVSEDKQQLLEQEKQNLQRLNQSLQDQISIIGGLSNAYQVVYKADLVTNTFVTVKAIDFVHGLVHGAVTIEDAFQRYIPFGVAPEDHQKMRIFTDWHTLNSRLADTDLIEMEYHGTLPEWPWCRASWIVAERDPQGNVLTVLYAVEDIGAAIKERQKQAHERELLMDMTEKRLTTMTEAIHGGFKISRSDPTFSFVMVSEQLAQLFGYDSPEELMQASGGSMAGLAHHGDAAREVPMAWKDINEGRMYTMHYRARCKDGSWKNIEDRGKLIRNENGEAEFWSFIVDQDELVQKAEALESARNANKALENTKLQLQKNLDIIGSLSQHYMGIYYIDLNTFDFQEINAVTVPHVQKFVGSSGNAENIFHGICDHLILPEFRDSLLSFIDLHTLADRLADKKVLTCQFIGRTLGWLEGYFIVASRDENGRCTHVLWAFRSIQELKDKDQQYQKELESAKEAAEEANRAKTTFLLNMSHDIRTPMNAILGYAQLMKKQLNDPVLLHYQEKMEQASSFLLSLINNVLDMARIESGQMELDAEYNEAGNIISGILNVFEEQAKAKHLTIHYSTDVQNKEIICDRLKLQEIFTNLISNAIKYTTDGGTITITTKEKPCSEEGYMILQTTVADTGIGMSREFLPHLFDTFTREKNTTEGKIAGTGLGMPIVKKYVELMGGTIDVQSELGRGSCFVVTFRHKLADRQATQISEETGSASAADIEKLTGKHILLAEDNELNAEIAITILEDIGFIVDHAIDGVQCVEKMEHTPAGTYDLILMDIQMPNMDGYRATQVIRRLADPIRANIPIIAMTANAFEEDRQNALRVGMNGHLAKPIEIQKLLETLAQILK